MASWIVHLRVAEKLLKAWPKLDPAQFAVGNITPDAGIPDEKWEKFTNKKPMARIILWLLPVRPQYCVPTPPRRSLPTGCFAKTACEQ